jgi:hypothetical protein
MTPCVKSYPAPEIDRAEILRYSGTRQSSAEIEALLDSCLDEVVKIVTYKVCYTELSIDRLPEILKNDKRLSGVDSAVIFAATVGIGIDRLIAKYGILSPSRALMIQAIGAERIESLSDTFCKEFIGAMPRFSPGYSTLPLEFQKDIFDLLNPSAIGLTLNSSLLMSPSKSVTAIFGLKK